MAYTTTTLTQGLADLGRRLYDPNSVRWTDAEKTLYLQEAVRTFNALTGYWRGAFHFPTVVDQHWYDLTTLANTLRPFTVTDVDLYTLIEYHFLEPPTGATWTGTNQFAINDLIKDVQIRRDQLLGETGCTIARSTQATNAVMSNDLDQTVIDIRRLAYIPNTGSIRPLWRDDQWSQAMFARNRITPGTPTIYKQSTQPPLVFRTNCPPAVPGTYELMTVNSGTPLTAVSPTTLIIPDDWAWVNKFGAMAELLNRDSAARDPERAAYCEQRYNQGVAAMQQAPALLNLEIDYTTINIDAVKYADQYRPGWQSLAHDTPEAAYIAGMNYFAFAPKPDAILLVTADVVQNAPFPASGGEFFQFGREDYDAILDYSQHIATFKEGGAEFKATMPLLIEFFKHCAGYNDKLMTMGEFTDVIFGQSQLQEQADGTRATPPGKGDE